MALRVVHRSCFRARRSLTGVRRESKNPTPGPPRATVAVVSFTNHATDPRVNRHIEHLRHDYRVISVGTGDPCLPGVEFVQLRLAQRESVRRLHVGLRRLRAAWRRYEEAYWSTPSVRKALPVLRGIRADVFVANDLETLPAVLRASGGAPVVFDAHEYAPGQFDDRRVFRWFEKPLRHYLVRTYAPRAAAMTTVSDSIARLYQDDAGVAPHVLWNACRFWPELSPPPVRPAGPLRLVHHGVAIPARRLERMIDAMELLGDRAQLTFMLVGNHPRYLDDLKARARAVPGVQFRDPVPMPSLPAVLHEYDLGVFLLPPTNSNYARALPNKLFEWVQARLGIVVGPTPEMASLVRKYGLGRVSDDFSAAAFARAIQGISVDDVARYRSNAHRAAQTLSSESSRQVLLQVTGDAVRRGRQS